MDPADFFPDSDPEGDNPAEREAAADAATESRARAVAACASCHPERAAGCLMGAIAAGDTAGVWGGIDFELAANSLTIARSARAAGDHPGMLSALAEAQRATTAATEPGTGGAPMQPERPCPRCGARVKAGRHPVDRNGPRATCGLAATYNKGCRCDPCIEGKAAYHRGAGGMTGPDSDGTVVVASLPELHPRTETPMTDDAVDPMDGPTDADAPADRWEDMIPIAPVYTDPTPLDADVFKPTELNLDMADLDLDEWARVGATLDPLARGIQIWGGDWYRMGDDKWGEDIHQVLNAYQSTTWYNWARVMSIITPDMRDERLLFSHYRYAAELKNSSGTPDKRGIKAALKVAIDQEMTTREFQEYIRSLKSDDDDDDAGDDDKSEAGEATSVSITLGMRVAVADGDDAKEVAQQASEYIEQLLAAKGIEPLAIVAPRVEFNRREAE